MKICLENVTKSYGENKVLENVSLCFENGVSCIMAPSGTGKTTLLRLILGLERPDSGRISVPDGVRFAAVFQENRLVETMSARDNLRFALGRGADMKKAGALLSALGLDIGEKKPVSEYSGGMKRRLSLARCLLAESDTLILDEPFTGLDSENRLRAAECLLHEASGKPVLLVTHSPEDAELLNAKVYRI